MRIGFLANNLNTGCGGGRYASELVHGLEQRGYQTIALTDIGENSPNPIIRRGSGMFFSAIEAGKLLRDCDIIHALDGYPYAIVGAMVNKFLKKKFIITAQGTYSVAPLYNRTTSWIMRWAYKQADKIIAISGYTRNEILKKVKLDNISVINHGIDLNRFYQEHENPDEKFILSVGAAKERKGYHISIPAFARISKKFTDYKYYIVADNGGKYLSEIAKREGIADRIVFLEGISDDKLLELYRKALLFILTPVNTEGRHFEGFGLVYLEAAAAGTPVIGTLNTGAEDAVNNGENGFLVPQNNIDAAADAIGKILGDSALREKMSIKSHEWAAKHDKNNVIEAYIREYKKLMTP